MRRRNRKNDARSDSTHENYRETSAGGISLVFGALEFEKWKK
jgi:hypothetical protein